jgi:hypothetical protein
LALSQKIIARLQLSQASLENLEAAGHAGMTTSQSLRELLPAFNQWDLKSNEIGMSHELCVRGTASENDEPAREAVGSLIIEAATATHQHAALIRTHDSGEASAQRIDTLSRLIDVYADVNQRLEDLPGEYPDKVEASELKRVSALIGEFKQLAQKQLNTLLPEVRQNDPPVMPKPAVAGPSRPIGKVTKTRPRDSAPAKASTADDLPLREVLPARPAPGLQPVLDDVDTVDDALTLNEDVQAFIDRTRKDAFKPNRIPADMQDLFRSSGSTTGAGSDQCRAGTGAHTRIGRSAASCGQPERGAQECSRPVTCSGRRYPRQPAQGSAAPTGVFAVAAG